MVLLVFFEHLETIVARTTDGAVQSLLGPNYDGVTDLLEVITTASVFVDLVVACNTRKGGLALGDTQLERIEAYVACHLYGHGDQFYQSRSTQGASGSFQGQTSQLGLEGSQYGQTALRLDTSGCLNAINNKSRAGMTWLGTSHRNITRVGGY